MIEQMQGLKAPMLGFRAHGRVEAEDYRAVLEPALEEALERWPVVHLLYVLDNDFDGFTVGAMWEDAKVSFAHFRDWDRIAIVTDSERITGIIHFCTAIIPGEMRVFSLAAEGEARKWLQLMN